ncbi:hypothetical protein L208DRAFT_1410524 [Tricholoma matsutake]|nr:hypothetical protein L208DRAFT_1410524 [Tricholoma matsutake 945]
MPVTILAFLRCTQQSYPSTPARVLILISSSLSTADLSIIIGPIHLFPSQSSKPSPAPRSPSPTIYPRQPRSTSPLQPNMSSANLPAEACVSSLNGQAHDRPHA